MAARIITAIAMLILIIIGYPVVRSPLIRQEVLNDYAARRGKYLGVSAAFIGDSQVQKNPLWGWHLSHDPLGIVVVSAPGGTVFQIYGNRNSLDKMGVRTVVLMGGTNDAFLSVPVDQSIAYYIALIHHLERSKARIIVTLAPPTRVSDQSQRLRQLNDQLRARLRREPVEIVELPELVQAGGLIAPKYVDPDGVHLNAAGYHVWEEKLRALHVG